MNHYRSWDEVVLFLLLLLLPRSQMILDLQFLLMSFSRPLLWFLCPVLFTYDWN